MENSIMNNKISTTVTEETLIKIVEKACDLTINEIRSPSRRHHLVIARSILGNMLRQETGCTYQRAGELVGRDHASVISYERNFKNNVKFYKKYRDTYNLVTAEHEAQYSDVSLRIMTSQIFQIETQLEILKEKQLVLIKNQ